MKKTEHLLWRNEQDTADCAARLARAPALHNAFVSLQGDLGAGKTAFVRHLLRALGVQGHVKSPTYAVVEPYETPDGLHVWHFDFYRFQDPQEWEDAGLRDLFAATGLKLAEWPERVGPLLPEPDLVLALSVQHEAARRVTLHAATPTGTELLSCIAS